MRVLKTPEQLRERRIQKCRATNANIRAARFGAPGRITRHDVEAILLDAKCAYCEGVERMGIDHIVPFARGGHNVVSNIHACCLNCNRRKWAKDHPDKWARDADECRECGTTERHHKAFGLCRRCWDRMRWRQRR